MQEIECIVSGKVFGVGYRYFVHKKAEALWLTGYVKNTPDYTVRVLAQGKKEQLEKLIAHLWKGPFAASVRDVSVTWRVPTETFKDFTIQY